MIGKEAWWKSWKVGEPCHNKEIKLISGYGREVTQGFFSVSSAYEQLYDIFKGPQVQGNLSQVWRMKIPLKVNFFVWRAEFHLMLAKVIAIGVFSNMVLSIF